MLRQPTRAVCELSHICGDRFSLLAAHSHSRLFEQRSDIRGSMAANLTSELGFKVGQPQVIAPAAASITTQCAHL